MPVDLFSIDCECGCAAKMPADQLSSILDDFELPRCSKLLVGPKTFDDAGVYKISDDQCLVQTIDYFPPVARDPYVYGQIAAANSLSDIYAMGGKPLTALAVVCFPDKMLEISVLREITEGAIDKLEEADTVLAGGHTISDQQLKYGFAVTGTVHPEEIMDNAHVSPGNVLILTKPLGTGIIVTAIKGGMAGREQENKVNRCMSVLNASTSGVAREHGATSCTDITGFGILGHAYQMAKASGVSIEMCIQKIPRFDGVLEFASMGLLSGATYSNRKYLGPAVEFDDDIELAEQDLLFDPQTSGGLLISCPEAKARQMMTHLREVSLTPCAIVGRVLEQTVDPKIKITRTSLKC